MHQTDTHNPGESTPPRSRWDIQIDAHPDVDIRSHVNAALDTLIETLRRDGIACDAVAFDGDGDAFTDRTTIN